MTQGSLFSGGPIRIKTKSGETYVRETSIEAYRDLKVRGLLGPMQQEVYDAIKACGPCTSGEAFDYLRANHESWNPLSQSRARCTELREKGWLVEEGKRTCHISGRRAIVWRAI